MKEWLYASKKEIENMTIEEAFEIVQRQIDLGHTKGEYRPRAHTTKAYEIVLGLAKEAVNTKDEFNLIWR